MSNHIHKTAIIAKGARIGEGVTIGPYCVIDDGVVIGDNACLYNQVTVTGQTAIGKNVTIFTGAVIGSVPQDLKYQGGKSVLVIGDNNVIREYCTFNPGTNGNTTRVGNHNLFMAYSHIAHDCHVGNHCVFANCATLAGHVTVEDKAVIGGLAAVHQFVRVGEVSIIGGCSKVVQDVPPFGLCDGHPARVYGINLVGLRRWKVSAESIRQLRAAFKVLFYAGASLSHAVTEVQRTQENPTDELRRLLAFIQASKRGVNRKH